MAPFALALCVLQLLLQLGAVKGALSDRVAQAGSSGHAGGPIYHQKPRVRREWRTLTPEVRAKVARAYWTLKNLTTEEGQNIYGPHFHNYDDMLMIHACTTLDPRCDQGHFGPQFMTFHRLLMLKFELAVLAVDPEIEALPYWNLAYDAVGGKYHDDPEKYFFSKHFAGSFNGTGEHGEVKDGLFANWPVAEYSKERFGSTSPLAHQNGKPNRCIVEDWFHAKPCECGKGVCPSYLRHEASAFCEPVVSRWPQDPAGGGQVMITKGGKELDPHGMGGTWDIRYTEADFKHCADPRQTPSWMEWQNCIEISAGTCFKPGTEEHRLRRHVALTLAQMDDAESLSSEEHIALRTILDELAGKMPPDCSDIMLTGYFRHVENNASKPLEVGAKRGYADFFHSQVHSKLGLDFLDLATSPNDVAAFYGYHSDIDRNNLHWMQAAQQQLREAQWAFPSSQSVEAADSLSGPKPYGMSGPFSFFDQRDCGGKSWATEYTGETPWLPGTLWGDVVNSGFPFYNLFEDYDGGAHGYTHGDTLTLTAPERTPYTYDTLEHLYY